jgi:hypothetical protein
MEQVEPVQVLLNNFLICLALLETRCVRCERAHTLLDFAAQRRDTIHHL